ncbi:MAG: LysE family transporter [Dehalococcoidia bacterium]|jgi:threonine/homoserine/homoserine lactone efflux protein
MMALLAIFGSSFLISLSGALMPGPLFTLSVRETLRRGFWVGPLLATGHALIELALVVGLALGLSEFLGQGKGTAAIAMLGGVFLIWMGYEMLRTAPRQQLDLPVRRGGSAPQPVPIPIPIEDPPWGYRRRLLAAMRGVDASGQRLGHSSRHAGAAASILVPAGVLVSVANPYWIIWWATIGMAYIDKALVHGPAGVGTFFTAHILSDFAWLSLVAFALVTGRRLMSTPVYRGILMACGAFLIGLGVWFIYSGVSFIT